MAARSNAQEPGREGAPALLHATLVSPQALRASHGAADARAGAAAACLAAAGAAAHNAVAEAFNGRCGAACFAGHALWLVARVNGEGGHPAKRMMHAPGRLAAGRQAFSEDRALELRPRFLGLCVPWHVHDVLNQKHASLSKLCNEPSGNAALPHGSRRARVLGIVQAG